jgi:hypothetical protein
MQSVVNLQCEIQAFSQNEVLSMIAPGDLQRIKEKDEHPYFRVYSICHEGVSTPRLIGEKAKPITWSRKAVQSLKNIVLKGVKFFKGHNADNSTDGRKSLGEIVANAEREIDGKLHHIAVGYFPNKNEVQNKDICSQEGIWNFIEQAGNIVASAVDKITGIALGNSSEEQPAFKDAKMLATVQAFEDTNITGDVIMDYKELKSHLSFDVLKQVVKDLNVFPWQLYTVEDLQNDRQFGKIFEDKTNLEKTLEEKAKELETLSESNKSLMRKGQLADAKTRLDDIFKEKQLTDKQKEFVSNRFNENLEDLTDEGLMKFVDNETKTFKDVAHYLEVKPDIPGTQEPSQDSDDFTKPENNPILQEE